jgi:hypothetical protein
MRQLSNLIVSTAQCLQQSHCANNDTTPLTPSLEKHHLNFPQLLETHRLDDTNTLIHLTLDDHQIRLEEAHELLAVSKRGGEKAKPS